MTTTVFRLIPAGPFSLGACLFFSISGFLMAALLDQGYKRFLYRRLLRIYPSFILAVASVLFLRVIFFGHVEEPDLMNAITLLPLREDKSISYPLGVEWTLVYEVFFYLICACFSNDYLRSRFPSFLAVWGLVIVVVNQFPAVSENLKLDGVSSSLLQPSWAYIGLSPKNLLFIFGGLAYLLVKRLRKVGAYLSSLLIVSSMVFMWLSLDAFAHSLIGTLYMSASFLLLISGSVGWERCIKKENLDTKLRPLDQLGERSYGIYLVHVPVIILLNDIGSQSSLALHYPVAYGACVMLTSFLVGWLFGGIDMLLHNRVREAFSRRPSIPIIG